MVSFILPVRNGADTVGLVVRAVAEFKNEPSELIVVDDASTDDTAAIVEPYATQVVRLDTRHGPAAARNIAIKKAKGDILFFLDSDIQPTVEDIDRVVAVTLARTDRIGVSVPSSPDPINKGFYPALCALQEHFYHSEFLDAGDWNKYPYVHTRFGTLRKDAFDRAGGFDESFTYPSIEDLDLSLRLTDERKFVLLTEIDIPHRWTSGPVSMWRRYFRNSYLWTSRIGQRTGQFDDALATGRRAAAMACGFACLALLAPAAVLPGLFRLTAVAAAGSLLVAHAILNIPLYRFFAKRKGVLFAVGAALNVLGFSVPITLGAVAGTVSAFGKGKRRK